MVMKERCAHMDERLKSTQEDNHRLRSERDGLRERVTELQASLKDKETEVRKICQMIEFGVGMYIVDGEQISIVYTIRIYTLHST